MLHDNIGPNDRVVATFTNLTDARNALEALVDAGFMREHVHLIENEPLRADGDATLADATADHPVRTEHRQGFFAKLFGLDDDYDRDTVNWGRDDQYLEHDRYFTDAYGSGRHVLIVDAMDRRTEVLDILNRFDADVDERAMSFYGERLEGLRTLLLREERLDVNKESREAGEVRIRKEIVTETKTIEVPVEREDVVIERRAVTGEDARGEVGEISASALREGEEVRIPLKEEEIHVEKRVVPKEEVRIGKQVTQETKRVTEDLKREEAKIERTGTAKVRDRRDRLDPEQPRL